MTPFCDDMPVVSYDPNDDTFVQDPYPAYRHMRAQGDLVYWEQFNMPVAVTQEAVRQVMRHPKLGRKVPELQRTTVSADLQPFYDVEKHSLLELEPPEHTRIRRIVAKGFGLHRMTPLAPWVSQTADRLIDDFPPGPFDLIEAYAQQLTALTIARFLGIDPRHADRMRTWSAAMVAMYQSRRDTAIEAAANAAAVDFAAFVVAELGQRELLPSDDFLTELSGAEKGGELSRSELISTVILLLNAGQEATAHAIGNAIRCLVDFPERGLALHPDNISNTIEECLRYTPPLHMFTRYVYQDTELCGFTLPAGSEIACLLGSASRDDAVWPDGEKFDPFRARHNHPAFGVGIHACTGAALARLEMQIALPVLFARCPDIAFTEPPRLARRYHFHGLEALRVSVR